MLRLAMTLYSIIGSSVAGTFVVAALVMGHDTAQPIIIAAILGFIIGLPVAWFVARAISD